MVRFRNIKPGVWQDLRLHFYLLRGFDPVPRFLSQFLLLIVVIENRSLILRRPGTRAWIVPLPEKLEQIFIRDLRRVIIYLDAF